MTTAKIEVRGKGTRGPYRLTEYRGENAVAVKPEQRKTLLRLAQRQAEMWQRCALPEDDVYVTEGERRR